MEMAGPFTNTTEARLTRRVAWAYLDAAFASQRLLDGDELLSELRRQGAPADMVELLRTQVRADSRFSGPDGLRRYVRTLPQS